MLRVFLSSYRGGSLYSTQYKAAIWWHDEEQRKKAWALKRRILIVWAVWMALVGLVCALVIWQHGDDDHKFWVLLALPAALLIFPGQLHVLPMCPWWNAEGYHQKYIAKQKGQWRPSRCGA
mmetsp:Transcript_101800/g.180534  ORF Transcript_101800/g.180534 Transcript_101800/m.180534 type:complete len:121 (+) Transcript_101800:291-653(+)